MLNFENLTLNFEAPSLNIRDNRKAISSHHTIWHYQLCHNLAKKYFESQTLIFEASPSWNITLYGATNNSVHKVASLDQKTVQTDKSSRITWNCSLRYFYSPDGETSPTFPKTHLWLKLIKIPRFIIPIIATSFRMSLGSGWHMVVVVVVALHTIFKNIVLNASIL